jgi:polysaccharide export outer membrane protein
MWLYLSGEGLAPRTRVFMCYKYGEIRCTQRLINFGDQYRPMPKSFDRSWIWLAGVLMIAISSCNINRNIMFKTDKDYAYNQPNVDSTNKQYRIGKNDFLTMQIFSNEGSLIVQYTTSTLDAARYFVTPDLYYIVDTDGQVELPILGKVKLEGMSIAEAQEDLEKRYSIQFNNPYCVLRVINKRVIVFNGAGSIGQVVPLLNQNVSVIEALALAGGIADRGDARKVKLIRKVNDKEEVYPIDLSTIEGVKYSQMAVQAGDIIYVEPVPRIGQELLKTTQPFVTLISGFIIIYTFLRANK